jgi:hypothetical protein
MKIVTILCAILFDGLSTAYGLGINVPALGQNLNGWSEKRTAEYTIDSQTYRTHVPTVTRNIDGGMFVSMRVEHLSVFRPDAIAYIELTMTPSGYVGSSQIRLAMNGKRYDTGQVLREEEPVETVESAKIGSTDWRSAHMKMVLSLFSRLDSEFAKVGKGENEGKRDLWGRLNGSKLEQADLSAALRHNLNILLVHVGYQHIPYE